MSTMAATVTTTSAMQMSPGATQCRQFVQNAWKKELCSNCFKSREEHASAGEVARANVPRALSSVKRVAHKVQGILRPKESSPSQVRSKRKNVAFPDSLTEIIGYDGGDDFGTDDDEGPELGSDDPDSLAGFDVDELPDSEEERALGNLTRANTNFNTVTANLNGSADEAKGTATRSFSTLMLGRTQKDSDGRKTTLLVSVKPFGGDDSLPTARRPTGNKKPAEVIAKPKPSSLERPEAKSDVPPPKIAKKPADEGPAEPTVKTIATPAAPDASLAGKIVDMPLITSTTSLMPALRDDPASAPRRGATGIARTPAIKKPENEKPRIVAQPQPGAELLKNQKNLEGSNGVELNLTPAAKAEPERGDFVKELTSYKSSFAPAKPTGVADLAERKVEGEAASDAYPFEESRESAGEPDGKADEELVAEPPALPKSPPPSSSSSASSVASSPAEPRASFLHGGEAAAAAAAAPKPRPTVPQKPVSLPAKGSVGVSLASLLSESRAYEYRQAQQARALAHSQSETQLCAQEDRPRAQAKSAESCGQIPQNDIYKAECVKVGEKDEDEELSLEDDAEELDSESSAEQARLSSSVKQRRMAPQPPEEPAPSLFARNPALGGAAAAKSDSPVVREKEKRERASSCSPKFRKAVCEAPEPARPPEPAPRRNISLSQDSLAAACSERVEEKKKARSKFSIKKFLRMGSRKDVDMTDGSSGSRSNEIPSTPQPKPRLEIIHPLELDGAAVQVVRNDKRCTDSSSDAQINTCQTISPAQHVTTRPSKPPPPPRAQSLDESSRAGSRSSPSKQQQPQQQQQQQQQSGSKPLVGKSWQPNGGTTASDSIYANLGPAAAEDVAGAIRSALAPAKPRRTSSMRDQPSSEAAAPGCRSAAGPAAASATQRHPGQRPLAPDSPASSDSRTYDCMSSSFDGEDSSLELRQGSGNHPVAKRQSDSGALESNSSEFKFQQSLFARSTSLPYCAGDADCEIYSPFSCYHGDEGSEDQESRICRLRQRRSRSIVHRSLEDNYGAVIVANHEALAQFLEQMNQGPAIPAGLRALKSANLRFRDFSVDRSAWTTIGRRIFFAATWNEQSVTLCVAFDPSVHASRKDFYLAPIVEFIDAVPKDVADIIGGKNLEATISVLPRLQVNTIKSFAEALEEDEHATRESSFVLLQLVSALKSLQAQGIEEAPRDLTNVVLCREEKCAYHRLYLFQGLGIDSCESSEEECASLCQCALNALEALDLAKKLPLIRELLAREKAVTLSQVKSVLEFSLWGPADVSLGGPRERETALQRWLDLERATVLHALVRARAHLTVADEYQLLFLVRTSAKIMCEASLLLDRQRSGLIQRLP